MTLSLSSDGKNSRVCATDNGVFPKKRLPQAVSHTAPPAFALYIIALHYTSPLPRHLTRGTRVTSLLLSLSLPMMGLKEKVE